MNQPLKIFIIYARKDAEHLKELGKHLAPLKRNASIALWHDREIAAGEDWEKKIGDNLKSADIIVMLISSDFLDSNYIQDVEMVEAKARWKRKEVDLVPVIVRPCAFQRDAFINGLQLLPADGKPIESSHWKFKDEAYKDVADGLGNKINAILEQKQAIARETEGKRQRAEAEALKLAQQKQLDFINQEVEKAVKIVLEKKMAEFQKEIDRQVAERFSKLVEEQKSEFDNTIQEFFRKQEVLWSEYIKRKKISLIKSLGEIKIQADTELKDEEINKLVKITKRRIWLSVRNTVILLIFSIAFWFFGIWGLVQVGVWLDNSAMFNWFASYMAFILGVCVMIWLFAFFFPEVRDWLDE